MDWHAWAPTYRAILDDFGWDEAPDRASAWALIDHLPRHGAWHLVGTELKHRPVASVIGCGPALDDLQPADIPTGIVVAADGACSRLQEIGVVPRVVVTDLDGHPDGLRWAAGMGATMIVHAHGDNIERQSLVSELGPFVVGTCQGDPASLAPLRNHGGFTDGDRAALLCAHYGVGNIRLIAFDAEAAPSRHSHTFDPALKPRKLAWAQRILGEARSAGAPISDW